MYKSFTIRNFRGFKNLTITPLGKINLIAGKNNVGKTALLEAVWLHHGYYNPELGVRINAFRGFTKVKTEEFLWDLFTNFDPSKPIELLSEAFSGLQHSLQISIRERTITHTSVGNGHPGKGNGKELFSSEIYNLESTDNNEPELLLSYTGPQQEENIDAYAFVESGEITFVRPPGINQPTGIFLAARGRTAPETLAERFGKLAIKKEEGKVVEGLKVIEPRLKSLTVQQQGGVPIIFGDIGGSRLMPMPLLGEGIGRLLGIILAIPAAQDGILLVDEIENGLHYSVMEKVWMVIGQLTDEYNVQLFATTQSEENIHAAHRAFSDGEPNTFLLHRLDRINDEIQVVTYDEGVLDAAIEMDAEVR